MSVLSMGVNAGKVFIDVLPNMGQFAAGIQRGINSPKMQKVGKDMTRKVTLPILAAGAASVKMATDFEASMSKIEGLVGQSRAQVAEWSDQILNMAGSVGKGPQELADALFFVTSAGFRGAAAMDVLEISAKGAAAGLGETLSVADAVTSAVNAYGEANMSAADAADVLTATVREGKAEAASIAPVLGSILPTASELGVAFSDVGAGIAAMTRTGDNAASSATKLNAIFSSLTKTTTQQRQAFKDAGLDATTLREGLGEKGLLPTLLEVKDAVGGNIEVLAQMFPNVRALRGVLSLTGSQADINTGIFDSLANSTGSLDAAFAAATETAKFKFDSAMAQTKATMIEVGQQIMPMVTAAAGKLGAAFGWFSSIDSTTRTLILSMLGLAAVIGPVILAAGKLATMLSFLAAHPVIAALIAMEVVLVAVAVAMGSADRRAENLRIKVDQLSSGFAEFVQDAKSLQEVTAEFERMREETEAAASPGWLDKIGTVIVSIGDFSQTAGEALQQMQEEAAQGGERAIRQLERLSRMDVASGFREGVLGVNELHEGFIATGLSGDELNERMAAVIRTSDGFDMSQVTSWINKTTNGVVDLNDGFVEAIDEQYKFSRISKREYIQALVNIGVSLDDARVRAGSFAAQQDEIREELGRTNVFLDMNAEAFTEWTGELNAGFEEFVFGATSVKEAFSISTGEMIKNMEAQSEIARQGAEDIAALNSNKNIDPEFKRWLLEQGPAAVNAFVEGGVTDQGKMQSAWEEITDATKDYGKEIGRVPGKIKSQFEADTDKASRDIAALHGSLTDMGFDDQTLNLAVQAWAGKKHSGGMIDAMAGIKGDELLTILQRGEFVVQRDVVQKPGVLQHLKQLNEGVPALANRMRMHSGGPVDHHTNGLADDVRALAATMRTVPKFLLNFTSELPTAQDLLENFGLAGAGNVSPSVARALPLAQARWPGVNFNPGIMVRGFNFGSTSGGFSQHSYGNALDQTPHSQALADWWRQMAGPLSVANTIYAGRSAYGGSGWNNYTGTNQHYDHVHTDFNPPGRGTPPPGGGWVGAKRGFTGTLPQDTLISAHAGEHVDVTPMGGRRNRMQVEGTLNIDEDGVAYLRGVAEEVVRDERSKDSRIGRTKR